MKIGLVQYAPIWESKEKSIEVLDNLLNSVDKDTSVLVFPEMTLTGFTMESKKNSEEIDGIGFQYFMNLANKLKVDIFAGIIKKENHNYFNSLIHYDNKGLIKAVYNKIHPFSFAKEDEFYSAGKEVVLTKLNNYKIGLTICYDLRFPELYRLYAKENVDLIINIANWPTKRVEHWKHLLKARAIENQCFIIGVNRVGKDASNEYNGFSGIFDPMGNELTLVENESKIIQEEINLDDTKTTRERFHFLDDMKLI